MNAPTTAAELRAQYAARRFAEQAKPLPKLLTIFHLDREVYAVKRLGTAWAIHRNDSAEAETFPTYGDAERALVARFTTKENT
jgi:hypothetical protein